MKKLISIITPTYNEELNIKNLCDSISLHMTKLNFDYEHIVIDNASDDNTQNIIRLICKDDKKVKAIFNEKNFGHIRSPYHALFQAKGDAVILIASDFQDPIELIPKLISKWVNGSQVVFLKRINTKENFFLEVVKTFYYKLINLLSEDKLIEKTTGSGIFDKKIIDELKKINEPYPYLRGLVVEICKKIDIIEFEQPKRLHGKSKNNFYTLFDLSMVAIVKHSRLPIRIMTILGFCFSSLSLLAGFFFLGYKIFFWDSFQLGLAPIVIGLFFGFSVLTFMLGLMGEYISSILTYIRKVPLVIEKERINFF
jgi:glycosyltransferase involved in cell wall biosynthesis